MIMNIKRIILITIICFLFLIPINKPLTESENEFRNAKWGMDKEQVRSLEKSLLQKYESAVSLGYEGTYLGLPVNIYYDFSKNLLLGGNYIIQPQAIETYDPYPDYEKVKKHLIKIYGQPDSNDLSSKDTGYILRSEWKLPKTEIKLSIIPIFDYENNSKKGEVVLVHFYGKGFFEEKISQEIELLRKKTKNEFIYP